VSWKRVLLKLSGEALGHPDTGQGIDRDALTSISRQVARIAQLGVEVALVCGGGNLLRGAEFAAGGARRASSDYMGMLGTVINGLALQVAIEALGVETRVLTALEIRAVAEPFVRRRAERHLQKGRVVLLAAGTGNPFFTTDTAAALRANELACEVFLKATKVDGIYTADPRKDPKATRYTRISYDEAIEKRLAIMDGTAFTLCRDNQLPIVVFDLFKDGNLERVVRGDTIGTLVTAR
jgi:uridylate kinase